MGEPKKFYKKRRICTGKWIFVTKTLPAVSISKHNARYVVKVYGKIYSETFSPTVSLSPIRVLLPLAAKFNYITSVRCQNSQFSNKG